MQKHLQIEQIWFIICICFHFYIFDTTREPYLKIPDFYDFFQFLIETEPSGRKSPISSSRFIFPPVVSFLLVFTWFWDLENETTGDRDIK